MTGSDDGTSELLESLSKENKEFDLVSYEDNRGYGAAIKHGLTKACYDFIAITDADDTYPNDRLVELLDQTISEGIDMLVGSRVGRNVHIPLLRRFSENVFKLIGQLSLRKEDS